MILDLFVIIKKFTGIFNKFSEGLVFRSNKGNRNFLITIWMVIYGKFVIVLDELAFMLYNF